MMAHILNLRSSVSGDASSTRAVAQVLLDKLQAQGHSGLTVRDLATQPIPHISGETVAGMFGGPECEGTKLSDTLVDEIMQADIWVIEAPMYNLGIPSSVKAWVDHIVRAGKTFAFTEEGAKGLIPAGKIVYVVSARGGVYEGTPAASVDFVSSYLQGILSWLGVTDIRFLLVEGTHAIGVEAARAKAIESLSRWV
ncbi:MAG: FMN-dependent NADH-azoreductase [Vampirovibrionales bacterium]